MNDQVLFCCLEVQEFEQVARTVGADAQALGRFMFAVDVIEAHGVLPCMQDVLVGQPVPVGLVEHLNPVKRNTFNGFPVTEAWLWC